MQCHLPPFIGLFCVLGAVGCWSDHSKSPAPTATDVAEEASPAPIDPRDVPLPVRATGRCRVYTPEPGFIVLVDGEPVRDETGERLPTPCEIVATVGTHTVSVAKRGFRQASRTVQVAEDKPLELVFEPQTAADSESAVLTAKYLDAPLAEPIPLELINTGGRELDPYLTADGLSLWFAGDRTEGRGLYVATRPSPYHAFGPPQFLRDSRSPDLAGSPSLTADALALVFTVPEKGRIYALTRSSPIGEFVDKKPLQFSTEGAVWPSAQVLGDGRRLIWTELVRGTLQTWSSERPATNRLFGRPAESMLPGGHPCLSSDGLRQYLFDGQVLRRARRADLSSPFSRPEVVASVDLPNYVPSSARRQFFVSDDEQWLVYCDDVAAGDLFLVRLFKGRGWGFLTRGKPISPRLPVAAMPADANDKPPKPAPPPKPADPRAEPLPYTVHWKELQTLLAAQDYTAADRLLRAARRDPRLADFRELLRWDADDLQRLQKFQRDLRSAIAALKPGDEVRIGNVKVEFMRFAEDVLYGKTRTREVERKLAEMDPGDLVQLVDERLPQIDDETQLGMGLFLYFDPRGNKRLAESRLDRAGEEGRRFLQRIDKRTLRLAAAEISRDNAAAGLHLLKQLVADRPAAPAAAEARQSIQKLYRSIAWQPVGSRQWQSTEEGEFVATAERAPNSYLRSPRPYGNFELRLEWKTTGATGQGGVYFRFAGEAAPNPDNAFKIHLANDYGVPPDPYSTGALFKVAAPDENAVDEEGRWNTLAMRVEGELVRVTINDRPVLEAAAQDAVIPPTGYVALDGEVGGIAYRKVLLLDLPDSKPLELAPADE